MPMNPTDTDDERTADEHTADEPARRDGQGTEPSGRPSVDDPLTLSLNERPTVPVFYHIPEDVAERALARFQRRVERVRQGDVDDGSPHAAATFHDYLYDEIAEQPVIYIEGEPLGEYASDAGLDTLRIDPTDDVTRDRADEDRTSEGV